MKMLLIKLNLKGIEASLTREYRYSSKFGTVSSRYKLTFWTKKVVTVKGTAKQKNVADTHEFNRQDELVKFMVVKLNEV